GADRLTAIDLRNGELRWRAVLTGPGTVELRRAGRVLCVTRGDGAVSALDIASGELLWRFARSGARFSLAPAVAGDLVIAASGEPGKGEGALYGIDLFSGRPRWERQLDAAPSCAPLPSPGVSTVALGGPRRASLAAFSAEDGELR